MQYLIEASLAIHYLGLLLVCFPLVFSCFSMNIYVFLVFSLVFQWKLMVSSGFSKLFNGNVCFPLVFMGFSMDIYGFLLFSMFFNEHVCFPFVFFGFSMNIYVFLWFFNVFQ